jgi:hypothetical protein
MVPDLCAEFAVDTAECAAGQEDLSRLGMRFDQQLLSDILRKDIVQQCFSLEFSA